MKELLKIWRGIRFFKCTNSKGRFVLISYHHPDSITWRWVINLNTIERSKWVFPKFGPSYSLGSKWFSPRGNFSGWLRLPFIGTLSVDTQDHMWRNK